MFGGVFGDVFGGVSGGVFGCLLGGVCACACSGWAGLQCSQSAQSVSQSSRSVHSRKWRKRRNRGMRRQGNGHVCDSRCIHQVKTCWRERQHTLLDDPRALQQRHLASHSSPSSDQDALVQRRHALLGNQRALQQRNLGGHSKRELHSPMCFAAATFRAVAHFAAGVLRVTPLARARGG